MNDEDMMEIILSYDKHEQRICILKSCPVSYQFNNQSYFQELNIKISPPDFILVLVNEMNERILLNEDIQQYIINTLIANIYKQNISIIQNQYLVYENDFLPTDF